MLPTAPGRESDLREPDALRDEYGRLRQPTVMAGAAGTQGLHSGGHNHEQRSRGLHSMAGTLINPAATIYARQDRPTQASTTSGAGGPSSNTVSLILLLQVQPPRWLTRGSSEQATTQPQGPKAQVCVALAKIQSVSRLRRLKIQLCALFVKQRR